MTHVIAFVFFFPENRRWFFIRQRRFTPQMILETGCRKYRHTADGIGTDVLHVHPRVCRYKYGPTGMQIALLIPHMNVNGSLFDKHNFILTEMFVRRYRISWGHVIGQQHEMPRSVVLRGGLDAKTSQVTLACLGPPRPLLALIFLEHERLRGVSEVLAGLECADRVESDATVTAMTANITSGVPIGFEFMRCHPFYLERAGW